jgi:hypothetical protein
MKLARWAVITGLVLVCTAFVNTPYGEDRLDAQIQRLREGKSASISDADFRNIRRDTYSKFITFAAELYVKHIKWSLISPEKQGGWPYRSFVVIEPEWIEDIYREIKHKAEKTGDSLFDYALLCPALYLVDEPEVQRILTRLERKDEFLHKDALRNLDTWRAEVAKRLRGRR